MKTSVAEPLHVAQVAPDGYPHWRLFDEQTRLLEAALTDLELEVSVGHALHPSRVNLVLGAHLMRYGTALEQYRFIPWQWEQLELGTCDTMNLRAVLGAAAMVWDYSEYNAKLLRRQGCEVAVLPMGWHAASETVPVHRSGELPMLFGGVLGDYRRWLLGRIEAHTEAELHLMLGVYGADKLELLSRARVHLHVHFAPAALFQQPRVTQLWANRCFVVCEQALDDPYPAVPRVEVVPEQIPEACRYYLAHPEECEAIAERSYRAFREHYPMTGLLREVLARTEAVTGWKLTPNPGVPDADPPLAADARAPLQERLLKQAAP